MRKFQCRGELNFSIIIFIKKLGLFIIHINNKNQSSKEDQKYIMQNTEVEFIKLGRILEAFNIVNNKDF